MLEDIGVRGLAGLYNAGHPFVVVGGRGGSMDMEDRMHNYTS